MSQSTVAEIKPVEVPGLSLPKGGGAIKGVGDTFKSNMFSGAGNYSIPLPVSSARGYEPELAVSYSSGAGNGIFGLGFELSLLKISVRTDTGIPAYQGEDNYLVGPEKLVRKDIAPYISGSFTVYEYLPLVEGNFALIKQLVKTDKSESYWELISAENELKVFGKSAAARISDPDDPSRISEWLMETSLDAKGNIINYYYKSENEENVGNEIWNKNHFFNNKYIASIEYGNYLDAAKVIRFGFEIIFDYGQYDISGLALGNKNPYLPVKEWDCRPDPFSSFRSGFEIRTCRLCQNILIFHHFEKELGAALLVNSLSFEYNNTGSYGSALPGISILNKVIQKGYSRVGKEAKAVYQEQYIPELEFGFSEFNPPRIPEFKTLTVEGQAIPGKLNAGVYQSVDLYTEGIPGILYHDDVSLLYFEPLGDGRYAAPQSPALFPINRDLYGGSTSLSDLDGNGELSLVVRNRQQAGFYKKTPAGAWKNYQPFERFPEGISELTEIVGLNSDGKHDLVLKETKDLLLYKSLGERGYANPRRVPVQESFPTVIAGDRQTYVGYADLFGDGLSHRVKITNGNLECWPNLGYGRFGKKITFGNAPQFNAGFDTSALLFADVDGSGTIDIAYTYSDRVELFLNQSGNCFCDPITVHLPELFTDIDSIYFADVLGNGTSCLVFTKMGPVPVHYYYEFAGEIMLDGQLVKSMKPYLLKEINNNLGTVTQVFYSSAVKFYLEDKKAGDQWATRLPFPVQVVEKTVTLDRISGSRYTKVYKYHEGYYDFAAKTFNGFGYVESWDTENYQDYENNSRINGLEVIDRTCYVPPVYTRTWSLTGAYFDYGIVSKQYKQGYYKGDSKAYDFPDPVIDPAIYACDVETVQQAYSSLKSQVIRTEVYALDGTPESVNPYTVEESNALVKLFQKKGDRKYAVFMVQGRESISYQYERNPNDPKIEQQFTLQSDAFGNTLQSCKVFLPRRAQTAEGVVVYPEQRCLSGILSLNAFVTPVPVVNGNQVNWFKLPWDQQSLELNGLDLNNNMYFSFAAIYEEAETALKHTIPYGEPFGTGLQARTLKWNRSYFWDEGQQQSKSFLPGGQTGLHALKHHAEVAEFTPAFLKAVYAGKLTDEFVFASGGYFFDENSGYWWNKGLVQYYYGLEPEEETNFYLSYKFENTFAADTQGKATPQDSSLCSETSLQYDEYYLNAVETIQLGNGGVTFVNQVKIDYSVGAPWELKDINNNISQALFNPLGQVVVTTLYGMQEGVLTGGMTLYPDGATPSEYKWLEHASFDKILAEPEKYLQGATSYFYYDMNAWKDKQQPASSVNLLRNNYYHSERPQTGPYCQIQISYTDGLGRVAEKKLKAGTPEGWLADSRIVYNNKAEPLEKYLPYFTDTPYYVAIGELDVLPPTVMHYDPLNRVIRTDNSKGFFSKVKFTAWEERHYDEDDTVKDSQYYINFFNNYPENPTQQQKDEKDALDKAAVFFNTPNVKISDNHGAIFRDIQIQSTGEELVSFYQTDIQGRNILAIDPRLFAANLNEGTDYYNFRYIYSMNSLEDDDENAAHKPVYINGADGGIQMHFGNIFGAQLISWSARNYCQLITYDRLQRKKSLSIKKPSENAEVFNTVEVFTYGDDLVSEGWTQKALQDNNLIGELYQLNDLSGIVKNASYSLQKEILEVSRQMTRVYDQPINWNPGSRPDLEAEIYVSKSTYNSVKQLMVETVPDGSLITNTYNPTGQLQAILLQKAGEAQQPVITDMVYNANGQKTIVHYGNGIRTVYDYDEHLFYLTNIKSTRITTDGKQEVVQHLNYTCDPAGNVTRVWDYTTEMVFNNNQKVDPMTDYLYDALYRLIRANGRQHEGITENTFRNNLADGDFMQSKFSQLPSLNDADKLENYQEIYTYDNSGNLIRKQHIAASASWTRNTEVEKNCNRLINQDYDESGNMRSLQINNVVSLSFNCCENLVKAAVIERPDEPDDCDYYLYDSQEQRTRKVSQRMAYGGNVSFIEEKTYFGNYEIKRKYKTDDPSASYFNRQSIKINNGDVTVLIVETVTKDSQHSENEGHTQYRYQLSDRLGSISMELDILAKMISYEEYFPYGGTAIIAGENQAEVSAKEYRYSGKECDDSTGLYYYGARYYVSWLGRWLNPDPAGTVDGMNLYAFVKNNPVTHADFEGKWIFVPAVIGGGTTAYMSYKIASEKGYTGMELAKLTLAGGIFGAATGHAGGAIAASSKFMAQTASMAFTSTVTSGALSYASSGKVDTVTSLGGISINWANKSVSYPFKPGNSTMDNLSLLAGLSANATDVVSLYKGGMNVKLVTEFDAKATASGNVDLIGHSAIVSSKGGINISVGPQTPFFHKGLPISQQFSELFTSKGGKLWPNYYGTKAGWTVPVYNVNKEILSKISANIASGKDALGSSLLYSGITNSCVGHTSDALMRVGVAPFMSMGLHPFTLHAFIVARHMGIIYNPYQQVRSNQQHDALK